MASNTIIVRVLGNTSSLSKSLNKARRDIGGLDQINRSLAGGFRVAAIGAAVFGAAAVGAGAAGAAALAAMPLALAGLGIAAAAQSEKVQKAFVGLADHVGRVGLRIARPLIEPLVKGAGQISRAFDTLVPYLAKTFRMSAPLLTDAFKGLNDVAKVLGPMLVQSFKAGEPVLRAFGAAVIPIIKGLKGFFRELGKGTPQFSKFVATLGDGLKQLLPAIGRLFTALAPIGTAILQTLVPALVTLLDWISAKVGPAFDKLTGTIADHPTLFRNIGLGILAFVAAIKVAQVAMAAFQAVVVAVTVVTKAFQAVALLVRGAIIVWRNAQLALNIAMMLNPIGLIIAAIVALVAVFVIAYKKSETFRKVVDAAWKGIKTATVAVWNFLKAFTLDAWNSLKNMVTKTVNAVKGAVTGAWNAIKSVSSRTWNAVKNGVTSAWNAIKSVTQRVWNGIKSVVTAVANAIKSAVQRQFNTAKSIVQSVWNAVKNLTQSAWNGIKNAVQNGVNAVINFVKTMPARIKAVFSGAAGWLLSAGKNIIQGLLNGITSMIGTVKNKLGELTNMIPDWKGPAAKDKRLLRPVGRMIMQGLIDGFDDGREGIKKTLGEITNLVSGFFNRMYKDKDLAAKWSKSVMRTMADEVRALNANAREREKVGARLEKAQERLNSIMRESVEYSKTIAQNVLEYANITGLGKDEEGNVTTAGLLGDLRLKVQQAEQYQSLLSSLVKMGLNKTTLNQLAQMGVEGGLATANAIMAGGKEAVGEINTLTGKLKKTGKAMGDQMADEMFGAGIKAAKGIIRGLKSQEKELIQIARALGQALTAQFKAALDFSIDHAGAGANVGGAVKGLGDAIKKGSKPGIRKGHDAGKKIGKAVTDGIKKGVSNGSNDVRRAGDNVAKTVTKSTKKGLKSKSPSRVFMRIGEDTLAGLEIGLRDLNGVKRATTNIGQVMTNTWDRPRLSADVGGGAAGTTIQITVNVPPTADKAAVGKEIQRTLDAYYAQGGRRRA